MVDTKPIMCRVCLLSGENYIDLHEEIGEFKIFEHITSITNVSIDPNDGFPKFICPSCLLLLEGAITLKTKCSESEYFLRQAQLKKEEGVDIKEEFIDKLGDDCSDFDSTQYLEPFLESDVSSSSIIPVPAKGQLFSPQCDECKQYFRSKCKLRVHLKKEHLKVPSFMCQRCKRAFKSRCTYVKHRGDKLCAEMVANLDKFAIIGEGKMRRFKCNYCDYTADRFNHMRTHFVVHVVGEKPYKCDLCDQSYTQKISLRSHIMEIHDKSTRVTCHVCGKELPSGRRFSKHMVIHRDPKLPCPVCKRLFKSNHRLKVHLKRHSTRKEYQCECCPKAFYSQSELINHRRIHKPAVMVACSECDFSTMSKRRMKSHQLQHEANKEYPCYKCGKFYDCAQRLRIHLRKYHKPKILKCPYCYNTYGNAKNVRSHIKIKHKDLFEDKATPTSHCTMKPIILLPKQSDDEDLSNAS